MVGGECRGGGGEGGGGDEDEEGEGGDEEESHESANFGDLERIGFVINSSEHVCGVMTAGTC